MMIGQEGARRIEGNLFEWMGKSSTEKNYSRNPITMKTQSLSNISLFVHSSPNHYSSLSSF